MYSLIIAEDELATRRGLVNMIRWNELGFRVDGEFSDGQQLLEYLKRNIPDVILTDIKMSQVSGLEVAKFVKEHNLPILIVFLSGYKEFSYAQSALEYHVVNYLIKPVSISKIRDVFRELREKLDKQSSQQEYMQKRNVHYDQLINYEKQQFVTDVYFGAIANEEQAKLRLKLCDVKEFSEKTEYVYLVKIIMNHNEKYTDFFENYGLQELQEQLLHVLNVFDQRLEYYPILWNDASEADKFYGIGVFWEKENSLSIGTHIEFLTKKIEETIQRLLFLQVKIEILRVMDSPLGLINCVDKISDWEESENLIHNREYLQFLREQNKLLYSYICQKDLEAGSEIAAMLYHQYMRGGIVFAKCQCIHTITLLIDKMTDYDLVEQNLLYTWCMTRNDLRMMRAEEIATWFQNCIRYLFEFVNGNEDDKEDSGINKVMAYIQRHYNEDITLTAIAENVFLNPSYISRMVKKQTGKNYTDVIMELRIQHAIDMLENTSFYVYEIAEKVGYRNLKYFYKVFKKVSGNSPLDYRMKRRNNDKEVEDTIY